MTTEMLEVSANAELLQKSGRSRASAEGLLIPAGTAIGIVLLAAGVLTGFGAII